jgi:MOSC domain-containing protein YiiM
MNTLTGNARIFQINKSDGGVPKQGVHQARVTMDGLVNDRSANNQHHGGPERALCLYSLENILALQEEGHPVFPGAMGENLTISGLDWAELSPGDRLRLGDFVTIEITRFTTPCSSIEPYFLDGKFSRVLNERYPGWSRVYARVLEEGSIQVGDAVLLMGANKD